MIDDKPILGIIGGSGLYEMPGLESTEEFELDTVFGHPSSPIVVGTLEGIRVAFLARHGEGHFISPTEINYRANIYALKMLGVEQVLSVSACGSLREDFAPGDIVIPNQLFDFTKSRSRTFFENGLVAHISVADPFCNRFAGEVYRAVEKTGAMVHEEGDLIAIEGPRFSTRLESNVFRAWGMSVIGMTGAPEAFLAREAEMCYAIMNHVTDYDVWHVSEESVTVDMVIRILNKNTQIAQQAIHNLARDLSKQRNCECSHALEDALITNPASIPEETREKLSLLVDRYLS